MRRHEQAGLLYVEQQAHHVAGLGQAGEPALDVFGQLLDGESGDVDVEVGQGVA